LTTSTVSAVASSGDGHLQRLTGSDREKHMLKVFVWPEKPILSLLETVQDELFWIFCRSFFESSRCQGVEIFIIFVFDIVIFDQTLRVICRTKN
jgi:hypothetical protein